YQQRGQQRRSRDERHTERHDAEFVAAAPIVRTQRDEFAHCQHKENESAGDLKVGDGNSKRSENDFAEKDETDRHDEAGENPEKRLPLSIFARSARAEPHENRDEPDRINRDKDRDEGEQKLFEHELICAAAFRFTGESFYTIIAAFSNETLCF